MTRNLAVITYTVSRRKRDFNIALFPVSYHLCVGEFYSVINIVLIPQLIPGYWGFGFPVKPI